MIKNIYYSLILYISLVSIIAVYTISLNIMGNIFWPSETNSSLIYDKAGNIRGSYLLAQKNLPLKYFQPRDNAPNNNLCNVALYNPTLSDYVGKKLIDKNYTDFASLFYSSSMLDPYITVDYAKSQLQRIAKLRKIEPEVISNLINKFKLESQRPFFELNIVNTTILNSKLDELK